MKRRGLWAAMGIGLCLTGGLLTAEPGYASVFPLLRIPDLVLGVGRPSHAVSTPVQPLLRPFSPRPQVENAMHSSYLLTDLSCATHVVRAKRREPRQ